MPNNKLGSFQYCQPAQNQPKSQVVLTQQPLTDGIFETGAYRVPSKSQNPAILGQGGTFSIQCSNPSWA